VDVARRRFETSFSNLNQPGWAIAFGLAVTAVVWLAARRERLLSGIPKPLAAALIGTWFAVVVGAISNDSGPLILEIGAIFLLLATGYARSGPRVAVGPPG
jgi:hypothetical protein